MLASFSRLLAGQICFVSSWWSLLCWQMLVFMRLGVFCWSTRFSASSTSSISTSQSGRLVSRSRLLVYISATAVLACAMLNGGLLLCFPLPELLIGFWLDQCVAVPFEVASRILVGLLFLENYCLPPVRRLLLIGTDAFCCP